MKNNRPTFGNVAAVLVAIRRALSNLVPPPDMLPSAWAEQNVHIPVGNAIPGPINFDNAPYQRGMLDVIKEPGVRRVSYMTGAQLGKTTVQQCTTGYFIEHEPRSQILVQPTQGDVQTFLETKLRPMLDANPSISSKMAKQRGREGVNNGRIISFIGGWLMFSWAGSPKTLRGRSAPVVQADEIDGYDATPEGDPGELLAQRAATFGDLALRTESSTPTILDASRIQVGFEAGDQRRYYVPCPHCDHAQHFRWGNVLWDGRKSTGVKDFKEDLHEDHKPETARYACEACGVLWDDGERLAAIRGAERAGHGWKASKPFRGHASFHAPEMLSTFRRLRDIVQSYLDKIKLGDIQSFVNVSLGEPYDEAGDKADPKSLLARCIPYAAPAPAGVVYITAGIDMQMDRLELEIVGWGEHEQSWSLDYRVLWGDPLQRDVWDDLDNVLAETFQHESGVQLPISAACLDTGGTSGYTQAAYEYARGKTGRRLFAVKGIGGWGRAIVEKPQRKQSGKNARKVDLFLVGTDEAKLVVMRRLNNQVPGSAGYCEFPEGRDAEYFDQLTAEKMVLRYVKGQPVREWTKPDRARNEALDCRVYALAALKIMQPSFKRLSAKMPKTPPTAARAELPAATKEWSAKVAETAVKLHDTLKAMQQHANDNAPPQEIPQEEQRPQEQQNPVNARPKRRFSGGKRKNWATNW